MSRSEWEAPGSYPKITLPDKGVDPSGLNNTHLSPSFWWFHHSVRDLRMGAASVGDVFIWMCCWPAERTDRRAGAGVCLRFTCEQAGVPAGWIILNLLHVPQRHTRTSINCGLRSLARPPSLSGWDPTQPAEDSSDWWQLFQSASLPRCHLLAQRKVILLWVNTLDVFVSVLNLVDESRLYLGDYWPLRRWSPFLMIFICGRWLPRMQHIHVSGMPSGPND